MRAKPVAHEHFLRRCFVKHRRRQIGGPHRPTVTNDEIAREVRDELLIRGNVTMNAHPQTRIPAHPELLHHRVGVGGLRHTIREIASRYRHPVTSASQTARCDLRRFRHAILGRIICRCQNENVFHELLGYGKRFFLPKTAFQSKPIPIHTAFERICPFELLSEYAADALSFFRWQGQHGAGNR